MHFICISMRYLPTLSFVVVEAIFIRRGGGVVGEAALHAEVGHAVSHLRHHLTGENTEANEKSARQAD